jgi:hypothetical protein
VHSHFRGIRSVKTGNITQGAAFGLGRRIRTTSCQKILEGFVGRVVIHAPQHRVDFREEIATLNLLVPHAPIVTINFGNGNIVLPQRVQDFRSTPVNKFGAQFDGKIALTAGLRENPAAYPITGFEDNCRQSRFSQPGGGGKTGDSRADHDDINLTEFFGWTWHQKWP